jgi:hypothetical protein
MSSCGGMSAVGGSRHKPENGGFSLRARAFDWDRSADHIRAGSQNGCTQRSETWLHPNDFAQRSDSFPLHGGRRPYMTPWRVIMAICIGRREHLDN